MYVSSPLGRSFADNDPPIFRGAGIGGLSVVRAIERFCDMSKLDVHLYEAAAQISEIGAGLSIWQRVYDILTDLGLESDMRECLDNAETDCEQSPSAFTFRKSDQPEGVTFKEVYSEDGGKSFLLHRAKIQGMLLEHISSQVKIHLSHRLDGYEYTEAPTEKIKLRFRGGQEARCDLLIAADGVHSVVRRQFVARLADKLDKPELKQAMEPEYNGSRIYRGLVPQEKLATVWLDHPALRKPNIYCGKDKYIVTYPIVKGEIVNVALFYTDKTGVETAYADPDIGDATMEEMNKMYEGWEPQVQALIKCMPDPSRHWVLLTQKPLETWADEGVMLLGDAASLFISPQSAILTNIAGARDGSQPRHRR
uniref:FAD-binding domain-containing protein n=1 Tax=Schizophyllum commune (strain H4-8 / FGSC 9210) TaxID=578458 RepID=D8QB72_SCHCM